VNKNKRAKFIFINVCFSALILITLWYFEGG
jgi:hypothetical protein